MLADDKTGYEEPPQLAGLTPRASTELGVSRIQASFILLLIRKPRCFRKLSNWPKITQLLSSGVRIPIWQPDSQTYTKPILLGERINA